MLDELGLGRRAGGEIEQQLIGGRGHAGKIRRPISEGGDVVGRPALGQSLVGCGIGEYGRLAELGADPGELGGVLGVGNQQPDPAPFDPVGDVARGQLGSGGNRHRAETDGAQHDVPQRHAVPQGQQQPIPAADPLCHEPVGGRDRPGGQLGKRELHPFAVRGVNQPEGRGVGLFGGQTVEPVGDEVERGEFRPPETRGGAGVVITVQQQKISGRAQRRGARLGSAHASSCHGSFHRSARHGALLCGSGRGQLG